MPKPGLMLLTKKGKNWVLQRQPFESRCQITTLLKTEARNFERGWIPESIMDRMKFKELVRTIELEPLYNS